MTTMPRPTAPIRHAEPALPPDEEEDLGGRPRLWTRDEYYRAAEAGVFDPDEKLELLEGEVVRKVSPQYTPHFMALRRTVIALEDVFGEGFDIRQQAPIVVNDRSEPEPDLVVARGAFDDYEDRHPSADQIALVVEISVATLRTDRKRKASLYAKAGIADYWLLNVEARQLEVRRNPVPSPEAMYGFDYSTVEVYGEGESAAPLAAPNAAVPLASLLAPAPPAG